MVEGGKGGRGQYKKRISSKKHEWEQVLEKEKYNIIALSGVTQGLSWIGVAMANPRESAGNVKTLNCSKANWWTLTLIVAYI